MLKNKSYSIFMALILMCALLVTQNVYALSPNSFEVNTQLNAYTPVVYTESQVVDSALPPTYLGGELDVEEQELLGSLRDVLISEYNKVYGLTGTANQMYTLYTHMFSDFTVLFVDPDLHGRVLTNIDNLNMFHMPKLTTIDVSYQKISSVSGIAFSEFLALEQIILSVNKITSFELPGTLDKLKYLNLNSNLLTEIDLSDLSNADVDLSLNRFSSIENITMPNLFALNDYLNVTLFSNNILDADQMYLSGFSGESKIKLELGLQGVGFYYKDLWADANLKDDNTITNATEVKMYYSNMYPNMVAKLTDITTGSEYLSLSATSTETIKTYKFSMGRYELSYFDENGNTLYDLHDMQKNVFETIEVLTVSPADPIIKYVVDGKEYDTYGKVGNNAKLVAYNPSEEGDIYYKVQNQDWVKGSEVDLKEGGSYNVAFKVVVGDFDDNSSLSSQINSVFVEQDLNPYISDVLMMLIIVVVFVIFVFVLIPLIAKYTMK